jgi:2-oxo-4-hydroxy-4-carboxy-5-ureidoimidazoline decarboxylase
MVAQAPFESHQQILKHGRQIWYELDESDWLEAFEGHPKIGDINSLRAKFGGDHRWSANEQGKLNQAHEKILHELARCNQLYLEKNAFIFIVFATGKTAEQMLEILIKRLENGRSIELKNAADQQWLITDLRLRRL